MFHCKILSGHAAAYYIGWIMNIAAVNDVVLYYYLLLYTILCLFINRSKSAQTKN